MFFPVTLGMEHEVKIINLLTDCHVNDSRRATDRDEVEVIYS